MSAERSKRVATRSSFLERLRNWSDQESWRRFLADYGCVIRACAVRAGLRMDEADDVVQETLLSVAQSIPGFVYDRTKGTFEGWVCRIAQRRVVDELRRRAASGPETAGPAEVEGPSKAAEAASGHRDWVEPFEEQWEAAWREQALLAGMERLRRTTSAEHFQILHMSIIDGMKESEIARLLGVRRAFVYLVRHRLGRRLRREVERFRAGEPPGP